MDMAPIAEPRPKFIADKIPDEAIIPPKNFGGLKLIGYHVPTECRTLTEPKMLCVETYWTIDEPTDKNYLLLVRGVPTRECDISPFGAGQKREFFG